MLPEKVNYVLTGTQITSYVYGYIRSCTTTTAHQILKIKLMKVAMQ
jgi:hypothetical protein